MAQDCMLTTIDNPFNPFDDFASWFEFDIEKGYYSCSRLARVANFEPDMTQKEMDEENERAIDEIVRYDDANVFMKVTRDVQVTPENNETDE